MLKILTILIKKITQGVKSVLGLKKKVTKTVDRALEIKEKIYETIDIVDEYKEQPIEVAKQLIPNLETKLFLMVVIIFTVMYIIGLAATLSGIAAWPIIGTLLLIIVGLITKVKEDDGEEESICT